MNANDAMLTALATAQRGSMVADTAPNAPANPSFDLILSAVAGSALAGQTLQCVASLASPGAQIVSIIHGNPFALL
jgi:hypothetical protein